MNIMKNKKSNKAESGIVHIPLVLIVAAAMAGTIAGVTLLFPPSEYQAPFVKRSQTSGLNQSVEGGNESAKNKDSSAENNSTEKENKYSSWSPLDTMPSAMPTVVPSPTPEDASQKKTADKAIFVESILSDEGKKTLRGEVSLDKNFVFYEEPVDNSENYYFRRTLDNIPVWVDKSHYQKRRQETAYEELSINNSIDGQSQSANDTFLANTTPLNNALNIMGSKQEVVNASNSSQIIGSDLMNRAANASLSVSRKDFFQNVSIRNNSAQEGISLDSQTYENLITLANYANPFEKYFSEKTTDEKTDQVTTVDNKIEVKFKENGVHKTASVDPNQITYGYSSRSNKNSSPVDWQVITTPEGNFAYVLKEDLENEEDVKSKDGKSQDEENTGQNAESESQEEKDKRIESEKKKAGIWEGGDPFKKNGIAVYWWKNEDTGESKIRYLTPAKESHLTDYELKHTIDDPTHTRAGDIIIALGNRGCKIEPSFAAERNGFKPLTYIPTQVYNSDSGKLEEIIIQVSASERILIDITKDSVFLQKRTRNVKYLIRK